MNRFSILIVDDEPLARDRGRVLLEADPEITAVHEARNGRTAIEAIGALGPDLVLLDVEMPEINGFDVISTVGAARMPPVIFVTAHDGYALKAFEVHALDYLLKPYSDGAFRDVIARAKEHILRPPSGLAARLEQLLSGLSARKSHGAADPGSRSSGSLRFKSGADILFVRPEEVLWFEAEGDYVMVHTRTKRHLVQTSLNGLACELDPALFTRIHRSAIVNMTRVARITPGAFGDCLLYLDDGTELRVSRTFRDGLLTRNPSLKQDRKGR